MTDVCLQGENREPAHWRLVCWLAPDGGPVRTGQPVAELRPAEADGPTIQVTALATGTLWHQVRPDEVLAVGQVVGLID